MGDHEMVVERSEVPCVAEDWRAGYEGKPVDTPNLDEERIFWNEPDSIVIKKSEYGGVLQKNWETAKDKLCGRFFYPDGNSLTWDVCARDRLRDFNLVCLKCGDVFACAPNNMTRTGNRHIRSKHPAMKCIQAQVPFYKQRSETDPLVVSSLGEAGVTAEPYADAIPLAPINIPGGKIKLLRCSDVDRKRLDRYVSSLLARCNLPSQLVEHEAFREFVEELTNNEYVPGDALVMEKEQDRMYSCLMDELKVDFEKQAPNVFYSLNADAWAFKGDMTVLALTTYCIDSKWRHLKATIAIRTIAGGSVATAVAETASDCLLSNNRMRSDRLLAITCNNSFFHNGTTIYPAQVGLACACYEVQSITKAVLHAPAADKPRIAPVQNLLKKFAELAAFLHSTSLSHGVLANLCLEVEPTIQEFPHPYQNVVDDRLDSELTMLLCLYRLKRVLQRGWEQMRLATTPATCIISEAEWQLAEQLIAVLSLVQNLNRALASHTVSVSKVYPQLLSLHRALINPRLTGSSVAVPTIAPKTWDRDIADSILFLREEMAARLEATYTALAAPTPLEQWTPAQVDAFEPYLIAMAVDPLISSTYEIFRHPRHNDAVNSALVASIKKHEGVIVQRAVGQLQSQWVHSAGLSRQSNDGVLSAALLASAEGFLHNRGSSLPGVHDDTAYGGILSAADASKGSIYGAPEEVAEECSELSSLFQYAVNPFDDASAESDGAKEIRAAWEDMGGWNAVQKSAELLWWERHANMFPWLSRLAAVYMAIPASSYGTRRFAPADGPQSSLGCTGFSPALLEKMVFVRENYHNGLLDVAAPSMSGYRKRKRSKSSSSHAGPISFADGLMDIPDHNRQQPPKFLHRLITSSVHLEGDVAWHTKVMHPTGKLEYHSAVSNSDAAAEIGVDTGSRVSYGPPSSPLPASGYRFQPAEPYDTFEWKLCMRHNIRMHLEAVRDVLASSKFNFHVDSLIAPFESQLIS